MKESKKLFAILLSVIMMVAYMPFPAFAAVEDDPEEGAVQVMEMPASVVPEGDLAESDELLQQFFDMEVNAELGSEPSSGMLRASRNTRRSKLNSMEQYIYDELLENMKSVASGDISSTEFTIDLSDQLKPYLVSTGYSNYPWKITSESLGIDSPVLVLSEDEYGNRSMDYSDEAKAKLYDTVRIVNALLYDQPYYAYWFDKTEGYSEGNIAYLTESGNMVRLFEKKPSITISFTVSSDYCAVEGDTYYSYRTDTARTAAPLNAAEAVGSIISQNEGKSDIEKLYSYKDTICDLTSYDHDAIYNYNTPYGDPWQLINVFDGDATTNVVCEGYSKAFQYLCDRTDFEDDIIECHTVTGTMTGGQGAGNHMWNILHMDDARNYIADITNCDTGYHEYLFLKGAESGGSVSSGYKYTNGWTDITYNYDSTTLSQYDEKELKMSELDYGDPEAHDWSEWISDGDQEHKRECKHDSTHVETQAHTWDGGKIAKRAGTGAEGVYRYTCGVCGGTRDVVIPELTSDITPSVEEAEAALEAAEESGDEAAIAGAKQQLADATLALAETASAEKKETADKALSKAASSKKAASGAAKGSADAVKKAQTALNDAEKAAQAAGELVKSAKEVLKDVKVAGYDESSDEYKNAAQAVTDAEKVSANADKAVTSANTAYTSAKKSYDNAVAAEKKRQGVYNKVIPKVKIKTPSSKKTSITVRWTKLTAKQISKSKVTKYEIWLCPDTKFRSTNTTIKTVSKTKSSVTFTKLKKNKRYYVKVRAVKYVKKVKNRGAWSTRKSIMTKKK